MKTGNGSWMEFCEGNIYLKTNGRATFFEILTMHGTEYRSEFMLRIAFIGIQAEYHTFKPLTRVDNSYELSGRNIKADLSSYKPRHISYNI